MTTIKFTCIGKGHGAPAIPATREDWEALRSEPWLADMCRRIAAGAEALKAKLPVWTPGCAEFKDNHRAIADAVKPLQRLMLDFDEKGHSEEILARAMELREQGRWHILLVEESVRKGTHVLITLPEGMTPQEAQQRFSNDIGFVADPALKDMASRCIYMVPKENTLYVNEELFSNEESGVRKEELFAQDDNSAMPVSPSLTSAPCFSPLGQRPKGSGVDLRLGGGGEASGAFEEAYDGIPYSDIVATLEEQMGGAPEHGSRNNFIFSMACHLRYVCNDDAQWIAQVLPTYGEGREKWMATIRSACNRNQARQMPRIMRRTLAICKERLEDKSEIRNHKSELPPEMPKKLPPLVRLLISRTPKIYQPAVAHAVFPALGAHLWKTYFRYIDNVLHEATLMNVLVGETGAGKNCISEPINHILKDIRSRDRDNLSREREWKREMQTKGATRTSGGDPRAWSSRRSTPI